jgi:ABC-type branched-subunit amino acid transport system substrate-binding protein
MVRDGSEPTARRRDVLRTLGVGGALALAGCGGDGDGGTPTESDSITFLMATAESGEYGQVGRLERNGFELAVKHLNQGGGFVEHVFDELDGDGVLGRTVETVVEDTENDADTAESAVNRALEAGNVGMVTGGVGGNVVYRLNDVTSEAGIAYMAGTAPVPELSGNRCAKTTFREGPHAKGIYNAIGPMLRREFGPTVDYHHLTSDSPEGEALQSAATWYFDQETTANWKDIGHATVRPGSTRYGDELETIAAKEPDVVVMNLFGLDASNAIQSAQEILTDDVEIVVPLLDDTLEHTLGSNMEGIIGAIPWDAGVDHDLTVTYSDEYVTEFGRSAGGEGQAGSGIAHVIYVETLLYAVGAERAGSFDGEAVATELEGMEYDVGLGQSTMRGCNHQSTRSLPGVRGLASQTADRHRLEVIRMARDVSRGCELAPAVNCSL